MQKIRKASSRLNLDVLRLFLFLAILLSVGKLSAQTNVPKLYVAQQVSTPIQIDGKGTEAAWLDAPWTDFFEDIEGSKKPKPYLNTRVKMIWDQSHFYFYAEMEEPHIWAKLKQRDTVIFHDNDFEIFIDPNGDTHNYYEFEVNALNTVWDLILTRPYRDGGIAIDQFDFKGLKTAVSIDGTLNNASDTDKGWSVEVAIPWSSLKEVAGMKTPPREGDDWRINFSRVQWETEIVNGQYAKKKDPDTGKKLKENNWTWSPQRAIAMHEPEFWGIVRFSAESSRKSEKYTDGQKRTLDIRKFLYTVHRAQRGYFRKQKRYSKKLSALKFDLPLPQLDQVKIKLSTYDRGYLLVIKDKEDNSRYMINEAGLSRKLKH